MSEQTTVPHSHYAVVAGQLEERTAQLRRKREQEQEIIRLLKSAGLRTVLEEEGSCIKHPLIEHVRHMVEWQKEVQKVRDALRKELERLGYTEAQLRELCGLTTPA